jgi:hypothetical protein
MKRKTGIDWAGTAISWFTWATFVCAGAATMAATGLLPFWKLLLLGAGGSLCVQGLPGLP